MRFGVDKLVWLLLAAVVGTIVLVPLIYTVNAAFYAETRTGLSNVRSLDAVLAVYTTWEYLSVLGNAVVLALVVTALSLVVGVAMALLIGRTDIPYKSVLDIFIILPLFLSPFTGLIAWIALGSEKTGFINTTLRPLLGLVMDNPPALINLWSYGGIVWVMFLFFCPFVYLFTLGSLRSMDSSLEEAARTSGASVWQTVIRITLPMSLPSIFAAGLLVFILAAEMYTIPGIIGGTLGFVTLPWRIYQDSTVFPVRQAHAAASGTILLWVTIGGVWMQRRMTRISERYVSITGKGFRGQPLKLGRARWLALAFIGVYVLSADILPFGALIASSLMKFSAPTVTLDILTTKHYVDLLTLQNMQDALINTALLAVLSGVLCVTIGLIISYAEVRRPSTATKLLAFVGVLPVAVPGLVYGIGLLWTYIQTPLYGTIWILLLAYVAKFLPYGILVTRNGVLQIHPDLEQSARMSGATARQALMHVTMPLMRVTLIAVLFFVMIMSIKELSASILLYAQKSQVLSVLTWHYMDAGNYQFAAAVGVVQSALMILLVVITRVIFRVRLESAIGKGGS
jgi:iron(III) transport system permease protein